MKYDIKNVLIVLLVLFSFIHTGLSVVVNAPKEGEQAKPVKLAAVKEKEGQPTNKLQPVTTTTTKVPKKEPKEKKAPKQKVVYKCPKVCDCPTLYQPVCGVSGLTHGNSCLAACFSDKIKSHGECTKCAKPKKVTKNHCSEEKYGNNGKRRRCCTWIQQGVKVINKKCKWQGEPSFTKVVSECKWKDLDTNTKQQYCCTYTKKTTGKISQVGKKTCRFLGKKISKKFKHQCRWQPFGEHGKRKYCCKVTVECKGKSCKESEKCSYTGPIKSTYVFNVCNWANHEKGGQQKQCCEYTKNCEKEANSNKSTCTKKKGKCTWVGQVIHKKTVTKCEVKQVGKESKRTHCCEWREVNKGGKVSHEKVKCYYKGCVETTKEKASCVWKQKDPKTKQRQCCTILEKCACGKCSKQEKCKWEGHTITKSDKKCNFVAVGSNGRQLECCEEKKTCVKDKCTVKKDCKKTGDIYTRNVSSSCDWVYIKDGVKRRKCCEVEKTCVGKKCQTKKVGCRFTGTVVFENNKKKHCTWKQHGKFSKRQECCVYNETCVQDKKSKKCSKKKLTCKFEGELITNEPKSECHVVKYATGTRKQCCSWTNYCEGKKCMPIRRTCKWEGAWTTVSKSEVCHWNEVEKDCKQRQCCEYVTTCTHTEKSKTCKTEKGKCVAVGLKVYTKQTSECADRALPDNKRQKFCCKSHHECKGDKNKCELKKKECLPKGPVHKTTVVQNCTEKKTEKYVQKRCCKETIKCVSVEKNDKSKIKKDKKPKKAGKKTEKKQGKKAGKSKNKGKKNKGKNSESKKAPKKVVKKHKSKDGKTYKCKVISKKCVDGDKVLLVVTKEKCDWEKVEAGNFRRLKCCKHTGKKVHDCTYNGAKVPCEKKYEKTEKVCTTKKDSTTCCDNTFSCSQYGDNKPVCKVSKSANCKTTVKKVDTTKAPSKPGVCESSGDPHYTKFDGKKFDFYTYGDWKLVESKGLVVHTRTNKWNHASVNTEFIIKCNGNLLRSTGESNSLLINGVKKSFKNGDKINLNNGGHVSFSENNRVIVTAQNGAVVDARLIVAKNSPQPFYSNIIVRVPNVDDVKDGLCIGKQTEGKGLFNHVEKKKEGGNPSKDCVGKKRQLATEKCKRAGITGSSLNDCIIDICENFSIEDEKKAVKDFKEEKKKLPTTKYITRPTNKPTTAKYVTKPTTRSTTKPTTAKHVTKPTTRSTTKPTTAKYVTKPTTRSTTKPTTAKHVTKPTTRSTTKPTTSKPTTRTTTKPTTSKYVTKPTSRSTTKPTTSKPTTRSTTKPTTRSTTKPTTEVNKYVKKETTTKPTTKATTKPTVKYVTKATTKPTTKATTKPTTKATTKPTVKYVTKATTKPTTRATTRPTTQKPTTKYVTRATTKPTTKATTKPTTKATTKPTVKYVTKATEKPTTKATTRPTTQKPTTKYVTRATEKPTTKATTKPTTRATTKPTVKYVTKATTKPTTEKPTTRATTKPTTRATTKPTVKYVTKSTTKPTTQATSKPTTKYVTKATEKPTTKATTKPTTKATSKPTTKYVTKATTRPTTKPTTKATTKPTTKYVTRATTKPTTRATTKPTTQATTRPTTQATTRPTTKYVTRATEKPTTRATTKPTTQATTRPTTQATTKPTTKYVTRATTQPTTRATTKPTTQTTTRPTVKIVTTPKPGVCQSTGDPHYLSFDGKRFDFFGIGDYKLLETSQLTIHTRTGKWNRASVNTEFVVKCNANLLRTTGESNSLLINGVKTPLKNGDRLNLKHGCVVSFSENNRVFITAQNGAVVDARLRVVKNSPQPFYSDLVVRVPNVNDVTDGLCINRQSIAQGLFNHVKEAVKGGNPAAECVGKKREDASKRCTDAGITGQNLNDCIIDLCEGFSLRSEIDSINDRRQEQRNIK